MKIGKLPPQRVWLWWSSGKDSAWALHELAGRTRCKVSGLVTTIDRESQRVPVHGTPLEVVRRQARAAGLPLRTVYLAHPATNADYEAAIEPALQEAAAAGVEAMAFGDLALADVRDYRKRLLKPYRLKALFPLWGRPTAKLARGMVAGGLEAIIVAVDPESLPSDLVGRSFDEALLDELPRGVDPCGENGEFHTVVTAGPMFDRPIEIDREELLAGAAPPAASLPEPLAEASGPEAGEPAPE